MKHYDDELVFQQLNRIIPISKLSVCPPPSRPACKPKPPVLTPQKRTLNKQLLMVFMYSKTGIIAI